jgi:hypothetical protein
MKKFDEDIPAYESDEMVRIIKNLNLAQRADKLFSLINFTRELQIAGIQMRNPKMSKDQVIKKFKKDMMEYYSSSNNE